MADGTSGAGQIVELDGYAFTREDGLGAVSVNIEGSTYDVVSKGLMRRLNSGHAAASMSFSVLEAEATNKVLLGKNGKRSTITYSTGKDIIVGAAVGILTVTRVFESRGPRRYDVDVMIDGGLKP
ncbi:MAG: hypothetical protein OXG44_10735 [Gammaproteobacteria bacterium]|nr:hypothetical protein [Gammaproteobacteria bacterium]